MKAVPEEKKPAEQAAKKEEKTPAAKPKEKPKKKAKPAPPPLTPEQKQELAYERACNMEEWIRWAATYQDRAQLSRQAAEAFEALGAYKDCPQRREDCLSQEHTALTEERDEAFEAVEEEYRRAKSAQDYYYAAQKLERFPDLPEAKKLLSEAKKRRKVLLKRKRLFRQGIAGLIVLFCLLAAAGVRLHIPQYAAGRVFQSMGRYDHALAWYNKSGSFADAKERVTFCRYQRGEYFLDKGSYASAYQKFRETSGYLDSDEKAVASFTQLLKNAKPGSVVKFGKSGSSFSKWLVLGQTEDTVTLISEFASSAAFDPGERPWQDSELRTWLNGAFLEKYFVDYELSHLVEQQGDKVVLLSAEQAQAYDELLNGSNDEGKRIDQYKATNDGWWLADPGAGEGGQAVMLKDGTVDRYGRGRSTADVQVRAVITVSTEP